MTTKTSAASDFSESATIFKFPPRGRFALTMNADAFTAALAKLPSSAKIASRSAWYHEEAIQEARNSDPRRRS
jgi:hypothetical protein